MWKSLDKGRAPCWSSQAKSLRRLSPELWWLILTGKSDPGRGVSGPP